MGECHVLPGEIARNAFAKLLVSPAVEGRFSGKGNLIHGRSPQRAFSIAFKGCPSVIFLIRIAQALSCSWLGIDYLPYSVAPMVPRSPDPSRTWAFTVDSTSSAGFGTPWLSTRPLCGKK